MSDPKRPVQCARHGTSPATFVCRHVAGGRGCGFHDAGGADGDLWPDAWCDKCQSILDRDGMWTDENLLGKDLSLLCTDCYENARANNRRIPSTIRPGQLTVTEEEYAKLVKEAHLWCQSVQAEACARWGFDQMNHWFYDDELGVMRFFDDFGGPAVVATADVAGSFSTKTNTWMWVWGNPGYDDQARKAVRPVSVFGEVRGIAKLAEASWPADEIDAWEVTQIAALLLRAEAIYRPPMQHLLMFMLLRDFRVESGGRRSAE